ncbi:hypothetical protein [Actinomadura sp. DC4]|uniref:hypothetical protein n=1 Tax=Actinomadura sp. DC4 TaxID=3055069 RepID=UPI0025B1D4FB|nr:hypothetical protein [Actinomadura sp. DC4]MDN3359516.1 hypothetical protein [Actinomadura sp. DC4]
MTLKVALLVTTAAGAVAAGGVTYATVGNSSHAPSAQAANDAAASGGKQAAPAAKAPAVPAVPAVPTCLPNLPKGQKLEAAKAKVAQEIKALAAKAPQTPVTLPALPTGKLPKGIKLDKVHKVLQAGELAKLPVSKLPTCKAGEQGTAATPKLPAKPGLPALPTKVSCDSVPKTIKNEQARAKEFTLPNGAQFAVAHAHKVVIQSRAACVYTQELVAGSRELLTVDRIQTPPQVTLRELAAGLKMPGDFVSVDGVDTWRTPANDGMLWYSSKGYAIRVTSVSPAATALVPGLASQLRGK